jgi:hypothetical protein
MNGGAKMISTLVAIQMFAVKVSFVAGSACLLISALYKQKNVGGDEYVTRQKAND